jgi:Putative peptidoglycan binding domain
LQSPWQPQIAQPQNRATNASIISCRGGGWAGRGHGWGDRGHGFHHGGRFFGPGFGFYGYGYPWWWDWYYPGYPYYGDPYYGDAYYGNPYYGNPYYGNPYYGNPYYGNAYYGNQYYENRDPRSSATKAIQAALARRGYYRGPIDGALGPGTRNAIRSFQAHQGLPVTGQMDGRLIRALQS